MKLRRSSYLLLAFLLISSNLRSWSHGSILRAPSLVVLVAGGAMAGFAEYCAKSCLRESLMIPIDAKNYTERKEKLLKKYKEAQKLTKSAYLVIVAALVSLCFSGA